MICVVLYQLLMIWIPLSITPSLYTKIRTYVGLLAETGTSMSSLMIANKYFLGFLFKLLGAVDVILRNRGWL